ncbi:hypothetical protein H0H92_008090 [Tricholoma furcatifolium]|nr:hypothetical protein H0H92_008089 [Tricholoma furcatifolium]KAG6811295.1 hypothetical protein H0H92_008090 [Tricholoma furcatifolium]
MFTPPASPRPTRTHADSNPQTPVLEAGTQNFPPVVPQKRQIARRLWWTVMIVPLVLVFITASTRFLVHPSAIDLLSSSSGSLSWHQISSEGRTWQPHKRHEELAQRQVSSSSVSPVVSTPTTTTSSTASSSSSSSSTSTVAANTPVPTVPSSPPTPPTPFPQPFDSSLTTNFSSLSCFNFFTNMTATLPFRSCRPLSLLLDSSDGFNSAETNLTLLNSIMWGTCNTDISQDQCISNMGWFAETLQSSCTADLQAQNEVAVSALRVPKNTQGAHDTDLRAYALMRQIGCLSDPTANTYCFLDAVHNTSPSDLYFYDLYQGLTLPNTTTLSCSACTRSVMSAYASALEDPTQAAVLTGLSETYSSAAKIAVTQCGSGYATTSANATPRGVLLGRSWWTASALLAFTAIVVVVGATTHFHTPHILILLPGANRNSALTLHPTHISYTHPVMPFGHPPLLKDGSTSAQSRHPYVPITYLLGIMLA